MMNTIFCAKSYTVVGTVASGLLPQGNPAIIGSLVIAIAAVILISKITDEQWATFLSAITAFFSVESPSRLAF